MSSDKDIEKSQEEIKDLRNFCKNILDQLKRILPKLELNEINYIENSAVCFELQKKKLKQNILKLHKKLKELSEDGDSFDEQLNFLFM